MILLLQVAIVLFVSRLVRAVFVRFHQPAVIGEMVAGLMLGPSLFGLLAPVQFAALFPPATLPNLNALSQIGLILFMFIVGLRLKSESTESTRSIAIVTSGTSIVVPFVLGVASATVVHARLAPPGIELLPFALFIGAAMSITAFPVLARILFERNLFNSFVGRVAIACAAFDDVTGWLILAGVVTLVHSENPQMLGIRVLMLVAYLLVMLFVLRPVLRKIAARPGRDFGTGVDDLTTVLLVMLVSAIATEWLGVHALFGAFFAGLMMPRSAKLEQICVDQVLPLTQSLLLPLFFAFTGLRTQVGLIDSWPLWRDALMFLAVAIAGKGIASTLAARFMGMGWRHASMLGILLNTRGLIELVILNVGLDLGILSPVVFSMLVLMALVTTFMTSPLLAMIQPPSAQDVVAEVA